jgi:hypothetical protein
MVRCWRAISPSTSGIEARTSLGRSKGNSEAPDEERRGGQCRRVKKSCQKNKKPRSCFREQLSIATASTLARLQIGDGADKREAPGLSVAPGSPEMPGVRTVLSRS